MSEDRPPEDPGQQPQFNPQTAYPASGAPNPYVQQPGPPGFPVYAVPDHPRATAALVVGIVSIAGAFFCVLPILASPVAWALGAQARRQIRSAPQQWSGEGRATAGMVLGIIGTVLLVLAVVALALLIIVAVNDSSTTFEDNTGV